VEEYVLDGRWNENGIVCMLAFRCFNLENIDKGKNRNRLSAYIMIVHYY